MIFIDTQKEIKRNGTLPLTFAASGLLAQMMNCPEFDYCTVDRLVNENPADTYEEVTDALNELIEKDYILMINDDVHGEVLAVNKCRITEMKII